MKNEAGAVMRVGRGECGLEGAVKSAQKSIFKSISLHIKFRVIDLPTYKTSFRVAQHEGRTHG